MTQQKKLILIDGSSLLSTSFFGNVPKSYYMTGDTSNLMQTSDGRFTNGVFTMSKILLNVIKKQKPTHMAIAWDISRQTFRREKYADYKGHRKETKPELGSQFGIAQALFASIGIQNVKLENFEADDIIGTFAKKFEEEIPVYIMTKDQDSLQLITEKTRVWLNTSKAKELYEERGLDPKTILVPDGSFEFTPLTFKEEYGLNPIQIIDLKALEGDSSDNIPGVKGVGKESVTKLLQEYETVENLYAQIEGLNEKEEEELKQFFKESLGISRSPIANLLKRPNSEIASEIENLLTNELDKVSKKMILNVFKEVDDKEFKEKVKVLSKTADSDFKEDAIQLLDELKTFPDELVGKKAAFLSKDLATIKTDIEAYNDLQLDELILSIDQAKMKKEFEALEFKSLIDKL